MANSSWSDAYNEFMTSIMPQLEEHGKAIGASAQAGNLIAVKLLKHYRMLHRSFDPMTAQLVTEALQEWLGQASQATGITESDDAGNDENT